MRPKPAIMRQTEKIEMATFKILSGKSLKSAIAGYGKSVSTFTEKTHQLAYSAINHVEEHHDAIYCNALYEATPSNYRAALVIWFKAFGKVTFDSNEKAFTYSKGSKSDLPTALTVSPADYAKGESTKARAAVALIDRAKGMAEKCVKDEKASRADKAFARAMLKFVKAYAGETAEAPATADNVVSIDKAKKPAKAAKAKAVKPAKEAAAA
jgi:hypothetical protein